MADQKISELTIINSTGHNPDYLWIPLYYSGGSPLNVRINASELFKTPFKVTAGAFTIAPSAIINDAGTSRTLSSTDNGKTLVFSSDSNVTVTVPAGLGIGYSVSCIKTGSGNLTYSASSTTLQSSAGSLTASGRYSVSSILGIATDTYNVLVGSPAVTGVTGGAGLSDGDYGDIIVGSSATSLTFDTGVVTAFSRTLLDDTGVVAWRSTLGLGTASLSATGDFAASTHTHAGTDITTGLIPVARLGSGTLNSNTFLNGIGAFVTGVGGGSLADANYVDITVSSSSTVFTINSGVVTYGKIQQIAPETLIGRSGLTSGVAHAIPISSFGRTLITAVDAPDARSDLGFTETEIGAFGIQLLESTGANQALFLISGAPLIHTHSTADITSGIFNVARLGSGVYNSNTFLNGAGAFVTGVGGGSVSTGVYNQVTVTGSSDWRITETANLSMASIRVTGDIRWFQKSVLSSATDGVLLVTNSGGTDFTRFQFGGTTASFPSLRRSGVEAHFETADGSANVPIRVSGVMSNVYKTNVSNFIINNATSYTLDASNNGKTFISYSSSAVTLTIASGLDVGYSLSILQQGAGAITVSGAAGVTLNSYGNLRTTAGQYAAASLLSISGNTWNLAGQLV